MKCIIEKRINSLELTKKLINRPDKTLFLGSASEEGTFEKLPTDIQEKAKDAVFRTINQEISELKKDLKYYSYKRGGF